MIEAVAGAVALVEEFGPVLGPVGIGVAVGVGAAVLVNEAVDSGAVADGLMPEWVDPQTRVCRTWMRSDTKALEALGRQVARFAETMISDRPWEFGQSRIGNFSQYHCPSQPVIDDLIEKCINAGYYDDALNNNTESTAQALAHSRIAFRNVTIECRQKGPLKPVEATPELCQRLLELGHLFVQRGNYVKSSYHSLTEAAIQWLTSPNGASPDIWLDGGDSRGTQTVRDHFHGYHYTFANRFLDRHLNRLVCPD